MGRWEKNMINLDKNMLKKNNNNARKKKEKNGEERKVYCT